MKKTHTVVLAILLTAITCSCSHLGGDGAAVSRSSGFESAGHSGSSALREDYGPASFSYSDSAPRSWDDVLVPDLPPVRAVESACADYSVDGEYARLLPLLSNETPAQEIMSETYPSVIMGIMMNLDREYTVTAYHIQEAKSTFPVSLSAADGTGRILHRQQGNRRRVRLYIFRPAGRRRLAVPDGRQNRSVCNGLYLCGENAVFRRISIHSNRRYH